MPDIQPASPNEASPYRSLASLLRPSYTGDLSTMLHTAILVVAGTALLALSAKVNVPLPFVPMTMQTLVVLLIGVTYGWRLGVVTILAYLAEGAAGLPVFAGPVGGVAVMAGSTGGYLAGFAAAVLLAGWLAERGWDASAAKLFAIMMAGHAVILVCGFVWLAFGIKFGVEKAWVVGVLPFLAGSIIKSLLGAALLPAVRSLLK